jgi:hypothetical protein
MRLSCTFFLKPLHWLVELPWLVASNDSRHIDHWGPSSYFNSWNSNVWTKTTSESLVVLYAYCWNLPISRQLPSGDWTVWWLNSLLDWKTIYRSSTWWFSNDLPIFTYNKWCLSSNSLMKKNAPGPPGRGPAVQLPPFWQLSAAGQSGQCTQCQRHKVILMEAKDHTHMLHILIFHIICVYTHIIHIDFDKNEKHILTMLISIVVFS